MKVDKNLTVEGLKVWDMSASAVAEAIPVCREVAADGAVLLKNSGNVLPLKSTDRVALFGRIQTSYYKSGTGSGGMVNVGRVPSLIDAIREETSLCVDEELAEVYAKWVEENPFDNGVGWGQEPWSQKEMPLSDDVVSAASERNDVAVIFIGRSAGEDHDNSNAPGSYSLSELEQEMVDKVSSCFKKIVMVLNVGNIINLSFESKVSSILYVWQGGMEGSRAVADLLCGRSTPNGRLADTQAYTIEDYPAHDNFGNTESNFYAEDIYVGYRYFETFLPWRVRYPFGFGLSYTTFKQQSVAVCYGKTIDIKTKVTNIGDYSGREVVQVYFKAPCGLLGTPSRQLIAYAKTKALAPNESDTLSFSIPIDKMAAYDDSGVTGHKSCYVLEAGDYEILVGTDVKAAKTVLTHRIYETVVLEQLEEIMAPVTPFERFVAVEENGRRKLEKAPVPLRQCDLEKRIAERRPADIPYTGDRGIKLLDVVDGKNTMEEFVAQLNDTDLMNISCGEGMSSPKVTAGTGGAIGGVTESLLNFGIPVVCVTDGPSGLRLDSGAKATSIPNGMCLACTFDDNLVERLHAYIGVEMFSYTVDALLGPGMNIHRHPLNGRNFEYFSEDPLLSGRMAAAISRGLAKTGCSSTIKHFCCNSQENGRRHVDAIVSERALREIYLKGFEIAVKEGGATAIMTAYNPVNGLWTASNYDLTTTLLRKEWGYKGMVMTDWWSTCNCEGFPADKSNLKAMVRAQNDVYMVCPDSATYPHNIAEGLKEGYITRGELQRNAINLLIYIAKSPTFAKYVDSGCQKPVLAVENDTVYYEVCNFEDIRAGREYKASFGGFKETKFEFQYVVDADELSQQSISAFIVGGSPINFTVKGTEGNRASEVRYTGALEGEHTITFDFPSKIRILKVIISKAE